MMEIKDTSMMVEHLINIGEKMISKILILFTVVFSFSTLASDSCEKLSIKLKDIEDTISESKLQEHEKNTLNFAIKGQMGGDIYSSIPVDEFMCEALYTGLTSTIELTFNNLLE